MSFSSQVKMELSQINNLAKKNQVDRELAGYLITGNAGKNNKKIKFSTESEYNIEIKGKIYTIEYSLNDDIDGIVFEKDNLYKADAEKVSKEIESISNATPSSILEYARNENSELHKCFEWHAPQGRRKSRFFRCW